MRTSNVGSEPLKYRGVLFSHQLGLALGICLLLLTSVISVGYLFGFENFYRPSNDLPATNPVTGLCLFLLGISALLPRKRKYYHWHRLVLVLVLAISLLRMFSSLFWAHDVEMVTDKLAHALETVETQSVNVFALNTSVMLFLIASGQFLSLLKLSQTSQVVTILGLLIPTLTLIGYLYHSHFLYSEMSVFTMVGGYCAGLSNLGRTAHHGFIRYLLLADGGGRYARKLLLGATLLGFASFALVFFMFEQTAQPALFAICLVVFLWMTLFIVAAFALRDKEHQHKLVQAQKEQQNGAVKDSLTGLDSRKELFAKLSRHQAKYGKAESGAALILFKIDQLRNINQKVGYALGDQILQQVAQIIGRVECPNAYKGRYSGDVFAVVITDTTQGESLVFANLIKESILSLETSSLTNPLTISVSVGMSFLDKYDFSLQDLLSGAEEAMRRSGRNSIGNIVCLGYGSKSEYRVANDPYL